MIGIKKQSATETVLKSHVLNLSVNRNHLNNFNSKNYRQCLLINGSYLSQSPRRYFSSPVKPRFEVENIALDLFASESVLHLF